MNEQKPKPCPFCGSTKIEEADYDRDFYACTDCDACGPRNLKKNGIDSWNTRATENKAENTEYGKRRLEKHLENINHIYKREVKRLRFELTVKYIGEIIGREQDHDLVLGVLREATR